MKKYALFLLAAAVLSSMAAAQAVIENPAKPLSEKAGRVVTLKEEMRIEDTGEGFFFKTPTRIRVSPRGDIFIKDGQEQALQFDPQGHFVRNLLRKGQGPGELSGLRDIWASLDRLYLMGYPPKILVYDYEGNLVQELILRDFGMARFILADKANLLLQTAGRPDPASGTGLRDLTQDIAEIAPDGASLKTIGLFPIHAFVEVQEGHTSRQVLQNILYAIALNGNTLFLNYTPDYLVEVFARDKGAVVRRFKRPYTRVKGSGGGGASRPGVSPPLRPEFRPDIRGLHVVDGKLWVKTSTVVAGKGILFDVYDAEGRYLDNFFIQLLSKDPNSNSILNTLTIVGDFIYFRDTTDDDLIVIKKCRLVGL